MAKIIAVCGAPSSGKTTSALKIAQEIYLRGNCSILFISPDTNTPALSYLFPIRKDTDLFSLGGALDKTSIVYEDILKQTVTTDSMKNFGFLGLKVGENKYSYAKPTEDKVREFLVACKQVVSFVVVDCSSNFDDLVSEVAMREANVNIQLISPDLRSMGYYSAYEEKYNSIADKCIKVINLMDNDIFLPIEEVKAHFKGVDFILPYCRALKQQAITGTLPERISDSKYRTVCHNIAKAVLNI